MPDYRSLEQQFAELLGIARRPVAVSFPEAPPPGVAAFEGTVPSGCSFWRLAAQGRAFYTVEKDHYNCPIGSYTHNVALPQERAAELTQTLSLMSGIGYIRMEEVPGVPKLAKAPAYVAYAPADSASFRADVVVIAARPSEAMLLYEAAVRAGAAGQPAAS